MLPFPGETKFQKVTFTSIFFYFCANIPTPMFALRIWTTGFPVTPAQRYVHTTTFFQEGSGACALVPQTPENRPLVPR